MRHVRNPAQLGCGHQDPGALVRLQWLHSVWPSVLRGASSTLEGLVPSNSQQIEEVYLHQTTHSTVQLAVGMATSLPTWSQGFPR